MIIFENSLGYLRESLSNYTEENVRVENINMKLEGNPLYSEIDFLQTLDEDELTYLNHILEREINYARDVQDEVRAKKLNEIYELLF